MSIVSALEKALATGGGPPVIWLTASNCTGCTVSLANLLSSSAPKDVADLLINTVNLAYHPNLMGAAGDLAVETLNKVEASSSKFILAVEGGVPTAFGGAACFVYSEKYLDPTAPGGVRWRDVTALEAVTRLAPKALAVLSIGTCASFGGIPGGKPNPTGVKSVKEVTGISTINISGCPAHPDWMVWTIAQLLAGVKPALDSTGRPKTLFGRKIHDNCPRRDLDWATNLGQKGLCLMGLGCKGPTTRGDCAVRKWNSGTNWCVGANALCLGCTESGFPDKFSPFFSSTGALPPGHPSVDKSKTCLQCHNGNPA